MENLDQLQLVYINLALLALSSGIALYLPKRMQKAQQQLFKPTIHPEFILFYKALNESLKFNAPILTYNVDKMPPQEFVGFYKGLQSLGFKLDLKATRLDLGGYSEYVVIDLASYTGPRSVEVTILEERRNMNRIAQSYIDAGRRPNHFNPPHPPADNVFSLFNRKPKTIPNRDENKVVDLNSYRKNKVIHYVPDGNEGA